jgi:hypothetical protein
VSVGLTGEVIAVKTSLDRAIQFAMAVVELPPGIVLTVSRMLNIYKDFAFANPTSTVAHAKPSQAAAIQYV